MNHLSAVLAFVAATTARAPAQAPLTPADLLAHGPTYDGKSVSVAGTIANVVHKTSHRSNPYTTFELCTTPLDWRASLAGC